MTSLRRSRSTLSAFRIVVEQKLLPRLPRFVQSCCSYSPLSLLRKVWRRAEAFVKDHVPCLSMLCRHRLEANGASTPTLFRCRGGDGKRLTGSDTEAACCPAVIEQTDSRSRGGGWRTAIQTHRQVG